MGCFLVKLERSYLLVASSCIVALAWCHFWSTLLHSHQYLNFSQKKLKPQNIFFPASSKTKNSKINEVASFYLYNLFSSSLEVCGSHVCDYCRANFQNMYSICDLQVISCYSSCSRKHAFVTLENKRESPNANAAKVGRKMAMSSYIMFVSVFGH